jgi:polyhydroxyalkanoate synthesis repressor PhaR
VQCGEQVFALRSVGLSDHQGFLVLRSFIVSEDKTAPKNAVVIKKYANRRLYNTATSTYVTLDDLSAMVKSGTDFVVYDAKTNEEITRSVLTQIIFEEENKGTNLLPINFLRQLIRYYGDSMQTLVPGYLEFSLENLTKEHDKIREQMMAPFTGEPFKNMEEHAKRNMAMFSDAMKLFNPFAAMAMAQPGGAPAEKSNSSGPPSKDDLQSMKDQIMAMQEKINNMGR